MIHLPVKLQESIESGSLFEIELYTINLNGTMLHIASCDTDIVFNDITYIAVPVQRSEISHTVDNTTDSCELTLSNTTDYFTQLLFSGVNPTGSPVVITKIIYPDSLANHNLQKVIFWGEVDAPELTSNGTFKVQLVSDIPNQKGGRTLQYACNSRFGDYSCGKEIESTNTSIKSVVDDIYVMTNSVDDKFLHGILIVNNEGRKIVDIVNGQYKIEYPFMQNIIGVDCTLKTDCDKSLTDCSRHNNRGRYGGFPSVPYEFGVRT